ncbi:MAG: bifunctional DNA primase/polymerase, partial [Chloroflexota bacterium]|nr:bifunctional DNA primase/polymerase [Chloroflexota bacterium]
MTFNDIIGDSMQGAQPIDWALRYAELGWFVFPVHTVRDGTCSCGNPECGNAGKHPRTKDGSLDATTDPGDIRRWWSKWPDANIGIALNQSELLDVAPDSPEWEAEFADRGLRATASYTISHKLRVVVDSQVEQVGGRRGTWTFEDAELLGICSEIRDRV